jgi:hypothetical protein
MMTTNSPQSWNKSLRELGLVQTWWHKSKLGLRIPHLEWFFHPRISARLQDKTPSCLEWSK